MTGLRTRLAIVGIVCGMLCLPIVGRAQSSTTGAIAGTARDATGAVLPGVTVEASSPALIEKVRAAVTDAQGNYKIIDLRPGTYAVTFSLPGFSTFRREGIELVTGFTATANAEMKIGALEETVTVSGASPIVDVQNVRTQRVLTSEVLDAIPINKTSQGFTAVTVGATLSSGAQDVGGSKGEGSSSISFHGSKGDDLKRLLDGMPYNSLHGPGGGQNQTHRLNEVGIQEVVLQAGSNAESETGGVQLNNVPRDGGNTLKVYSVLAYTNDNLQASNLTDALRARGLTASVSAKKVWDYGVGIGGPIMRDRLWFYSANRWWGAHEYQPGAYFNKTLNTLSYTPDLDRPAYTDYPMKDYSLRFTWQAASLHKVTFSHSTNRTCLCYQGVSSTTAPEASSRTQSGWNHLYQTTWNYPRTNRLLLQAGASLLFSPLNAEPLEGLSDHAIGVQELSTGLRYGARAVSLSSTDYGTGNSSNNLNQRASLSYVTGSHAFKTGVFVMQGWHIQYHYINDAIGYTFRNGLPVSLTEWASPSTFRLQLRNFGTFAQDQWTLGRMTLNYGMRFDRLHAYTMEEHLPAARFVPARDFAVVDNVPLWKDVTPRAGVAYDVFGNGRTAIKGAFGRYVASMGIGLAELNHPSMAIVTSVTRTWTDGNNNFVPDCDLQNRATNGECGAISNNLFGTAVINTRYADDVLLGLGSRPYNWQGSVSVQHELRPGVGLNVGYFRTWYGNFSVTDNLAVTPADFDQYCVTVPTDTRLPGGGGNQLCGLYDVKQAKFGQVNNLVTQAANFGSRTEVYNGADITVDARLGKGRLITGGIGFAKTVTDDCAVVDSPQQKSGGFCHVSPPWSAGTQLKFSGVYPLPGDVETSFTLQNLPGLPIAASLAYTNAQVAPSLGRNLAAGAAGTVTIPILEPQRLFEDRLTQLDVRVTKTIRLGSRRLRGNFDIYNLLNAATVLGVNTTYGPAWLRPTLVLGARLFKFGAQFDF